MSTVNVEGFELAPQQRRLWRLRGESAEALGLRCRVAVWGEVTAADLQQALGEVVQRHEILRTTFFPVPGMELPLQTVEDAAEDDAGAAVAWLPAEATDAEVAAAVGEPASLPTLAARWRARSQSDESGGDEAGGELLLGASPLTLDAAGAEVLVTELAQALEALRSGGGEGEADEAVQYADLAAWQNELLTSEDTEADRKEWHRLPVATTLNQLDLPLAQAAPETESEAASFEPRSVTTTLTAETAVGIARLSRDGDAETALLAVWAVVAGRWSGREEVVVSARFTGRDYEELEGTPGPLERFLPLRCDVARDQVLGEPVGQMAANRDLAAEAQHFFDWQQARVDGQQAADAFPRLAFRHQNVRPAHDAGEGARLQLLSARSWNERFLLLLDARELEDGDLELVLGFDSRSLTEAAAERLLEQLCGALAAVAEDPEGWSRRSLGELPLLTAAARRRLLVENNRTDLDLGALWDGGAHHTLHQPFEAQARRTPDAPAVVLAQDGGGMLTYAQLESWANRLARYLRDRGVGPEVAVGLSLERSLALPLAVLAVLKAGGFYVPLDPAAPAERSAAALAEAQTGTGARLLLCDAGSEEGMPRFEGVETLSLAFSSDPSAGSLEVAGSSLASFDDAPLELEVSSENAAYAIFTSGSTGRPKGVMVSHGAICNRLAWMQHQLPLEPSDRLLQKTPYVFDASIWELFLPLWTGARLVLAAPGAHGDPAYLVRTVAEEQITVLQLVPSMLQVFLAEEGIEDLSSLRRVFCGGERLDEELCRTFHRRLDAELHNLYGPTEASIDATWQPCPSDRQPGTVAIGRPLANVQVYVVDAGGEPLPEGLEGELYIGGAGLARGYLGRPALTAASFVPDAFAELHGRSGGRLYRSGDLARLRADGAIEYRGRRDQQIKLRGFRIELGEIEARLNEHPRVREAVVLAREDRPGDLRLVAYVVAAEEEELYRLPNGLEVAVNNPAETDVLYREIFEDEAYLRHGVTLEEGDQVVDVGANVGFFGLYLRHRLESFRLLALEPVPAVFRRLRTNLRRYGIDAVTRCVAVGAREGSMEMVFYPRWSTMSGLYADPDEDAEVTRAVLANIDPDAARESDELLAERFQEERFNAPVTTLSKLLREHDMERVDLLKLDAEKAELEVLQGLDEEDWDKVRQMVVEVHDLDGRLEKVQSLLEDHGFDCVVEQDEWLRGTGMYNLWAVHRERGRPGTAEAAPLVASGSASGTTLEPVTEEQELEPALRGHLAARLPEYMMPAALVQLPELPRLPSGKLDRSALPAPEAVDKRRRKPFQAPATETEKRLADLWRELLEIERVSVHDSFFEIGGHSLLATQLVSRIRRVFGAEVSLRGLFEEPTLGGLAAHLEGSPTTTVAPSLVVDPQRGDVLPLSYAQQRLWFLDRLDPGNAAYNLPMAARLRGELDQAALEQALSALVQRHEALRTRFEERAGEQWDGEPVQVVLPPYAVSFEHSDLSRASESDGRESLRVEVAKEVAREVAFAFDLEASPPLRVRLVRTAPDEVVLMITVHHIVSDGWSTGLLLRELATLYNAYRAGEPPELETPAVQYGDFTLWQRRWLEGGAEEEQLAYWRGRLGDPPAPLALPQDRPRPAMQTSAGASCGLVLPASWTETLEELAAERGATPFMLLLAVFQAQLARYSGSVDIAVGTPSANRDREELEGLVGLVANTLVLRTDLGGDPDFDQLLERVQETCLGAWTHSHLPFERLVEAVDPQRDLSRSPLFQVLFTLHNEPLELPVMDGLEVLPLGVDASRAQFDWSLAVTDTGKGMAVTLEYNTDLFDACTARRALSHYRRLLGSLVQGQLPRLSRWPLVTTAEHHQLCVEWAQGPRGDEAGGEALPLVPVAIARRVQRQPQAPALSFGEETWSYGELDRRARWVARRLRHQLAAVDAGREPLVGIHLSASPWMLAALLGTWYAGAAYVPLDPDYPTARLAWILDNGGPAAVIAAAGDEGLGRLLESSTTAPPRMLVGEEEFAGDSGADSGATDKRGTSEAIEELPAASRELAYVLYTSGSTGRPKGVAVSHGALANFLASMARRPGLTASDRLLAVTSLSFDIAALELYLPLLVGAQVVLAERPETADGAALARRLDAAEITVMQATPSTWRLLVDAGWSGRESLRALCGGEALPPALAAELMPRTAEVWNLYGPTETTVWSSVERLARVPRPSITLGRPLRNTHIVIVGAGDRPVPAGVPGELLIGGAGLARGYYRDPARTAAAFVPDSLAAWEDGGRLYRTGDLARWTAEGRLEYLGRRDHQVKVRGHRIELGEVEAALEEHGAVERAVVRAFAVAGGGASSADAASADALAAYVVCGAEAPAAADLRAYLRQTLPDFMIPSAVVFLDQLPLTPNGKIDRKALPAPDQAGEAAGEILPPADTWELRMLRIWEDLFGREPLGVTQDFFDLGGHSLLAVRLMARVRETFQREVPLAALFRHPTVRELAASLRRGADYTAEETVVALEPRGERPIFFCIHPIGGDVLGYLELSRALGPEQPFYGVRAPLLAHGEEYETTIEEIAADYLEQIREAQPEGPYYLGGGSFGGIVAFEMGRQLLAAGEEVALLALLDTIRPVRQEEFTDADYTAEILGLTRELAEEHDVALTLTHEELEEQPREDQLRALLVFLKEHRLIAPEVGFDWIRRLMAGHISRVRAALFYEAKLFPGPLTLFKADEYSAQYLEDLSETARRYAVDPTLGWQELSPEPVVMHHIPGTHASMYRPPNVGELAQHLAAALERARDQVEPGSGGRRVGSGLREGDS